MSADKADHEKSVVIEFCRAASLLLDEQSIEAGDALEPDVLCLLDNRQRYFELARLLDSRWPELMNWGLRNPGEPIKPQLDRIGLPERDMLVQKLSKRYETNGIPCDLVLYFDADFDKPHLAGAIPWIPFQEHARHVMQPILEESMGPFERVWVYERYTRTVLWRFPVEEVDAA